MAVAAMTIAWGGCTTCVERNLHWYSTRVDGGMCSCGAPQSGSDITGLVSPGLCGAGCAVQGGEEAGCEEGALRWSVRRQRRSAPCAWRAAVVLPRIRARPRAEMMGENYWVPPHSPAQAASCSARGAQRREPDAMEERALRTPSPQLLRGAVWWWSVAMAVGSAPERGDGGEGATSAR